jgi:signal transduction histidine kinase
LKPLLTSASVDLLFEPSQDLPPLYTDEAKVAQVLRNLISNALKFTEQGEVRVTARLSDDGASVIFSVRDTGIGIAPDVLPKIFELFTRASAAVDLVPGGLGVGLAMVKEIVELHGGSVQARSAGAGKGSEFTVRIPSSARA